MGGADALVPRLLRRELVEEVPRQGLPVPVRFIVLHLGTREMQLVLLKCALLYGVAFYYGTELIALQAPSIATGHDALASMSMAWRAWIQ